MSVCMDLFFSFRMWFFSAWWRNILRASAALPPDLHWGSAPGPRWDLYPSDSLQVQCTYQTKILDPLLTHEVLKRILRTWEVTQSKSQIRVTRSTDHYTLVCWFLDYFLYSRTESRKTWSYVHISPHGTVSLPSLCQELKNHDHQASWISGIVP